MYRIRLYIVPEQEEQSGPVKLPVKNDNCWWNDNNTSARVSVLHRGSKRNVITLGGDTNDRKERKEILRKNKENIRQQVRKFIEKYKYNNVVDGKSNNLY